jgi:hypothetical protein
VANRFDILLKRLERRRADRIRRTSANSREREFGGLYPPTSVSVIESAEGALGFPLPPLLREIYQNLANGGFGPGYGLVGLAGGYTFEDFGDLPLVEYHLMLCSAPPEDFHWSPRLLNIAHGGCLFFYAIDCSQPEYPVILIEGRHQECVSPTFIAFMERWADGLPDML